MKIFPARRLYERQCRMVDWLEQRLGPVGTGWSHPGLRRCYYFDVGGGFRVYTGLCILSEQDRLAFRLTFGV